MRWEKIKEYLRLLPEGVRNIDKIAEGISNDIKLNHGTLPEDEQEEIFRRRAICATCPFMSKNARDSKEYFELTGVHYESFRGSEHCSFCGCPLKIRTASLGKECGVITWNKENPGKELELKWDKYEQK